MFHIKACKSDLTNCQCGITWQQILAGWLCKTHTISSENLCNVSLNVNQL